MALVVVVALASGGALVSGDLAGVSGVASSSGVAAVASPTLASETSDSSDSVAGVLEAARGGFAGPNESKKLIQPGGERGNAGVKLVVDDTTTTTSATTTTTLSSPSSTTSTSTTSPSPTTTTTTSTTSTTTAPNTTTTTPDTTTGLTPSGPIRITESNVVIENMHFTGSSGNCIHIEGASNVTIRNSQFTNCYKGVYALNSANVVVEGSLFEADMPDRGRNAVQFDKVNGGKVINNTSDVTDGGTLSEDHISIYKSSGTSSNPILVSGNRLRGGGPSGSGSGIMVGDAAGSHIVVSGNVLVNPGQVGIGVASGENIRVIDNKVYSDSWAWSNVGIYVWNQYSSTCSAIEVSGNQVNWTNSAGKSNGAWNSGNCGTVAGWDTNDWNAPLTAAIW